MSGDQVASAAFAIGCMVLVGGGLVARRLPAKRLLGLALLWAGIFAGAALLAHWLARVLHNVHYQT
jgi:hypothetical protein